jgi:hypothetical protein
MISFAKAVVVSQPFYRLESGKAPMKLRRMPPLPITSSGCQPTPNPVHGGIRAVYP